MCISFTPLHHTNIEFTFLAIQAVIIVLLNYGLHVVHHPPFLLKLIFLENGAHPEEITRCYKGVFFLGFGTTFIMVVPLKEIEGIEK